MNSLLYMLLMILVFMLIVLIFVFLKIKAKEANQEEKELKEETSVAKSDIKTVATKTKIAKEYETKSIFDFMEFEEVKDNMIIQKDGKRFLMVIECQGVNYDLMSEVEKASTEQGFSTFLNTLREPIQIYIQTRKVNLEKNIQKYKEKVNKVRDELNLRKYRLKQYQEKDIKNSKVIEDQKTEILRSENLYAYGKDIIADTERMSLNKNILRKNYYIILKYFYESVDNNVGDEEDVVLSSEEIRDVAFGNLYTRCASMIRVLSGMGIVGRTLNSYELVDLLYNAYNRDDSEIFGIEKAIESGFNDIYVDTQNIIDKKIYALTKEIEMRAEAKAKEAIEEVISEEEKELKDLEKNIDNIVGDLAVKVVQEKEFIKESVKEKAVKKIKKDKKKGE